MTSTMVRALNDGGAFVTLHTCERTTYIRIDISEAEEWQSDHTGHYFGSFIDTFFIKARNHSGNYK